ncbi:capsular exopolysaccharide synthesis family protein [Silvibacterium bohemicum]|uniref:non-specific protein-tyrosine kinase n=1 Tax=Silvibacterium bohemicum TaxID=1577686 RepID=A0A841JVA9_9BACT|nr:polysaccharide biosynthesis tyrosine autokinase [Silvibacterium bohemicum]MBB6143679.1 capsular exopolysaccharide synthesis family protein [Silvibacterium bohemicum]
MKRFPEDAGDRPLYPPVLQPQTAYDPADLAPLPPEAEEQRSFLLEYYRTVARHRFLIISLALCGVLASVILHLTTLPVYRTRTSLEIHSLNGDFMNMRSIDPTEAPSTGETNIQTQIKLLESDSLMERTGERLTAENHPEFVQQNDTLSRLRRLVGIPGGSTIPFNDLLNETSKSMKVKQLGVTRLIEITCDSWDASFAARFCNTLVTEYQSEDLESRGSEAKRTSDWLMRQASDIRQKAEDGQRRLVAATGGDGLVLSQGTDTVGEDRLRKMQSELVKAQADRMEKEAQVSVVRSSPAGVPGGLESAAYAAAQAKLADLEARVAAIVPPLTEANPKVIHLRAEIKEAQDGLEKERTAGIQRLQSEYSAAKHREELLEMAYNRQESSVSSDLQKGSQVNLLRREVESEQQLYQTLLQRAKEAGFASAMQASTIRVIDEARPPRISIYPNRIATGITSFIVGALLGAAIAFFKDRNTTVLREPGESKKFLHVEELGVIPSPAKGKFLPSGRPKSQILDIENRPCSAELQTARWSDHCSLVAEAYRNATLSILLANRPDQARIYVISSPGVGEGKTTVTSNLGVALSKSGLRVVLIDGDMRKPSLHRALSVPNTFGLRNVLRGEVDLSSSLPAGLCKTTAFPQLSVIPSGVGKEQAVELLHSSKFGDLLTRLSHEFDVVLVDTPPVLHISDARVFARQAHGAILIVRSGVTTREQAMNARDILERDRVPVMGTILNDFNPAKGGNSSYYNSYYAYQQHSESESDLVVNS